MTDQLDPYPGNLRKHEVKLTNDPAVPYTPMLSDEAAKNILKNCAYNAREMDPVHETRAFYEQLLASGELIRKEELVKWLESMRDDPYEWKSSIAYKCVIDHLNKKP